MQETWTRSLGQEDPLEKGVATTPVLLPGKSRGQRSLAGYTSRGRKRVGHDLATEQEQQLSNNSIGLREESTTQSHTAFQSQRRDSDSVHQIPNSIPLSKPVSEETWTDWICGDPGATFGVDSGPRAAHAPRPLFAAAGASIHTLGLHVRFLQVLPRLHPIFSGISFMPQVIAAAGTLPLATLSAPQWDCGTAGV